MFWYNSRLDELLMLGRIKQGDRMTWLMSLRQAVTSRWHKGQLVNKMKPLHIQREPVVGFYSDMCCMKKLCARLSDAPSQHPGEHGDETWQAEESQGFNGHHLFSVDMLHLLPCKPQRSVFSQGQSAQCGTVLKYFFLQKISFVLIQLDSFCFYST